MWAHPPARQQMSAISSLRRQSADGQWRMQIKRFAVWREGLAINIASNGIGFLVGCLVAYLRHEGSEWVSPLLFGALAWFLTMGIWVIARLFKNIPIRSVTVTDDNLQVILRNWLDEIGLTVRTTKEESAHFMFVVTTDGGRVISNRSSKASIPRVPHISRIFQG